MHSNSGLFCKPHDMSVRAVRCAHLPAAPLCVADVPLIRFGNSESARRLRPEAYLTRPYMAHELLLVVMTRL